MKLLSMEKQEWRSKFKKGESFRSKEIYKCKICKTKTNKVLMTGCYGYGPKIICPAIKHKNHVILENAYKRIQKINNIISEFKTYKIKPSEHVIKQKKLLQLIILKNSLKGYDDIKGSTKELIEFYP